MKTKSRVAQYELPGSSEAFNLAVETTEDGERLRRELDAAEKEKLLAKATEEKQQPKLL